MNNTMNKNFSIIPRELFYIGDSHGLIKEYSNDKLLLLVDFFETHRLKNDKVEFTIGNVIQLCGYKIDYHEGKSVSQFKDMFVRLEDSNIINNLQSLIPKKGYAAIADVGLNDYLECDFDIVSKNSKTDKPTNFIQLFQWEKDKILNYKESKGSKEKIDCVKMLVYYCYIKSRIYKRSKASSSRTVSGGRNETCHPPLSRICDEINITKGAVLKYNQILTELNMIRYDTAGLWHWKDSDCVLESNNTYTLYCDGCEDELKDAIAFYKSKAEYDGKVFIGNSINKEEMKKMNGYIGRVNYLEKMGKASEEKIKQRDEYERIKEKLIIKGGE